MKSIISIFLKSTLAFIMLFLCYTILILGFEQKFILRQIIFPSMIFSFALTLIHILFSKKAGIKNDYSVYQKAIIKNEGTVDDIKAKISKVTSWTLVAKEENKLVYRSSFNTIKSFGEIITISSNKEETMIVSKPIVFATLFDFGKNYENIKLIKSII